MAALSRLSGSNCANPVLDLFTSVSGILTDIDSASFQIFDRSSGSAVQVYPTTPGQKQAVDVAACPAGDKLGTGHYVARWDVPSNENLGTHEVRWFFKLTSGSPEQTFVEEFEVLAEVVGAADTYSSYCFVQDLRDEGVPASYTDAFLQRRISLVSRMIEAATRRHFYPKAQTLKVDGRGGPMILLNNPIIAIEEVLFDTTPYSPSATPIEADLLVVYNRHLSQGLTSPDDRDNPKIELFHPSESLTHYGHGYGHGSRLVFPRGQQNVTVKGIFGYTDPDGSAKGKTPDLITHAAKLMVIRELTKMGSSSARFDARNRHRITSERTRDQAYTLGGAAGAPSYGGAGWTGDPEIDNILAMYCRPPALGAV